MVSPKKPKKAAKSVDQAATDKIVVVNATKDKPKLRGILRNKIIRDICIVVVIILIALGVWLKHAADVRHQKALTAAEKKLTTSQLVQQINTLEKQGNYKQAQYLLSLLNAKQNTPTQRTSGSTTTTSASADALALLATTDVKNNDYKDAISVDQEIASKYGLNAGLALNMAELEQAVNNKSAAIYYYQQAITQLKKLPSLSQTQTEIANLQQTVTKLQQNK